MSRRHRAHTGGVLPLLAIVFMGVVVALPLASLFWDAFADPGATWHALQDKSSLGALGRSIALAAAAVAINTVFGVGAALVLVRDRFWGRRALSWVIDMPLAMSPVMIGLGFFVLYGRQGWLAPLVSATGLQIVFAFPGMLLATLFVTLPFVARETQLVLEHVGADEEAAAATLGATRWQTFVWVTLPKIMPGVTSGAALMVARALGEFGAVLVIGGAISGRTDTATTFIYDAVEERRTAMAYGVSIVLVAMALAALATFTLARRRSKS